LAPPAGSTVRLAAAFQEGVMANRRTDQKQASREEIVRCASERFRKDGLAAVGVRKLMADAGLTHGAFYAHFPSRADLVSAALEHGVESTLVLLREAVERAPEGRKVQTLVQAYLSPAHRDHIDRGCAASALAPEISREDTPAREHFERYNSEIIQLIADTLPAGGTGKQRHACAQAMFAGMMGTLQLMRIATRPRDIDDIMQAGRKAALLVAEHWPRGAAHE
jgi:TetR/AcrR family transcriptional regulator, transcriptional repressor for nem operon